MSTDEAADRVEQAAMRIGSVLDQRWAVDSLLGIGGMAAVYAATADEERVAIKVLHPELTRSQRALDRFRREGDALRAAVHPAVPRVHGEGKTSDGCPYLVMELLLGETVEARRQRFGGKLAWAEVVQIALDVLDVLEVVHARGLLHRDVKPSNVLLLDDGSIRLIDFGIAKTVHEDQELALTRTGALPGSLAFMSPEHAMGIPSEVDTRSDLWSLGATMFLLLSGRPVHESQTDVEALVRSASRRPRSLGSVESDLPEALVAVVDRALSFDRRKRFADAGAMRDALQSLSSTHVHGARKWPRKWFFAVVAAGLLGIGAASVSSFRRAPPKVTDVDRGPPVTFNVPDFASAPLPPAPAEPDVSAEPEVIAEPKAPATPSRLARRVAHDGGTAAPSTSASTGATAAPGCDPPFVIDPTTGTRRVKPGC